MKKLPYIVVSRYIPKNNLEHHQLLNRASRKLDKSKNQERNSKFLQDSLTANTYILKIHLLISRIYNYCIILNLTSIFHKDFRLWTKSIRYSQFNFGNLIFYCKLHTKVLSCKGLKISIRKYMLNSFCIKM